MAERLGRLARPELDRRQLGRRHRRAVVSQPERDVQLAAVCRRQFLHRPMRSPMRILLIVTLWLCAAGAQAAFAETARSGQAKQPPTIEEEEAAAKARFEQGFAWAKKNDAAQYERELK